MYVAIEVRRKRDRSVEADAECVPVGGCSRDRVHAEHPAGAGLVLDHDRLIPARA